MELSAQSRSFTMKQQAFVASVLAGLFVLSGCQTESQTGAAGGAAGGAALGAGIGYLAGGAKGALIGGVSGGLLGGGAGYLIGKNAEEDRKRAATEVEYLDNAIRVAEKDRAASVERNLALSAEVKKLEAQRQALSAKGGASESIRVSAEKQIAVADAGERELRARISYLEAAKAQVGAGAPGVAPRIQSINSQIAQLNSEISSLQQERAELARISSAVSMR